MVVSKKIKMQYWDLNLIILYYKLRKATKYYKNLLQTNQTILNK